MNPTLPQYEVFAIKYAERDAQRRDNFLFGDPHEGPMPMDYYVWAIRGGGHSFVLDCGFTAEMAAIRKRRHLRCPVDALRLVGIDPDEVEDVIISHLHYDHAGNLTRFPKARFHLQEAELQFCCGRHMQREVMAHAYECEDVVDMVRLNFGGRVRFHDGMAELAPGLSIHGVGGHSPGMQFVRVHTARGWVVLASDTSHYYDNIRLRRPFPGLVDVAKVFDAWDAISSAADSFDHIVPGHDPLVMKLYPSPSAELEGVVARLDVAPRGDSAA
jgi:glyoxylase-like metal-dependent hydrolase (beta-lactamase superfamily II)